MIELDGLGKEACVPIELFRICATVEGVEYLAICKKREVNDDVAAEMVFRAEDLSKAKSNEGDENSEKYIAELRKKATITER